MKNMKNIVLAFGMVTQLGCATFLQHQCDPDVAYDVGILDRKEGRPSRSSQWDICPGSPKEKQNLKAFYRKGYETRESGSAVLTVGGVSPAKECVENYGLKKCGYGCVDAYGRLECSSTPGETCVSGFGIIRCGRNCHLGSGVIQCDS